MMTTKATAVVSKKKKKEKKLPKTFEFIKIGQSNKNTEKKNKQIYIHTYNI